MSLESEKSINSLIPLSVSQIVEDKHQELSILQKGLMMSRSSVAYSESESMAISNEPIDIDLNCISVERSDKKEDQNSCQIISEKIVPEQKKRLKNIMAPKNKNKTKSKIAGICVNNCLII
jgi:hypothetical protein